MLQTTMMELVPRKLKQIEEEYGVRVLMAVEAGSRAWGIASPDSDFDVRFLYVHPKEWYLRLEDRRDVIEMPVDDVWDLNGWDLDKALRLLRRSNPVLFEWVLSPITYLETDFRQCILPLMKEFFSEKNTLHHYANMARNNMRMFLSEEMVRPKKYFYVLRPLLACSWIMKHRCPPPVLFRTLVESELPHSLDDPVNKLLELKTGTNEKAEIPHMTEIDNYLEEALAMTDAHLAMLPKDEYRGWEPLNRFYLDELSR